LQTSLSATEIGVGQPLMVQLSALTPDAASPPSSPLLNAPPAFVVQGPNVGTQRQVSFGLGGNTSLTGLTATWRLIAQRKGTFTVGPASVVVAGRRLADRTFVVRVVDAPAASQAQPQRRRRLIDPFGLGDPFDDPTSLFGSLRTGPLFSLGGSTDEELLGPSENRPPELDRAVPLDPVAFIDAKLDQTKVVVGQQVTLTVVAYGSKGPFRESYASEPSRADFLSYPIVEASYGQPQYRVRVGNALWMAAEVRKIALFPLRAGRLTIGASTWGFDGPGYARGRDPKGLLRTSAPLTLEVVPPPVAHRPPGFRQGDVGHFSLTAEVDPRTTTTDGAVSIRVQLSGLGNLPRSLALPEIPGLEWLEPRITEDIGVQDGKVGGKRQFSYVVRPHRPGHIELGPLELPYWDPSRARYDVARAALGALEVGGLPAPAPSADAASEPGTTAVQPRQELGPMPSTSLAWSSTRWFWGWLLAGPTLFASAVGMEGGLRRWRGYLAASSERRRRSPEPHLQAAREAAQRGDASACASNLERALFVALEARWGLKPRGMLREELRCALVSLGTTPAFAEECSALLDACDGLRFTGDSDSPTRVIASAEDWLRTLSATGGAR